MISSMEVSLYPLGKESLGPDIDRFLETLNSFNVTVAPGSMSTVITGETSELFRAVEAAYTSVGEGRSVVLVTKISNACPV